MLFITDSWIGSALRVYNEINMALSEKSIHTNTSISTSNKITDKSKRKANAENETHMLWTTYRLLWLQLWILFGFNSSLLPFPPKACWCWKWALSSPNKFLAQMTGISPCHKNKNNYTNIVSNGSFHILNPVSVCVWYVEHQYIWNLWWFSFTAPFQIHPADHACLHRTLAFFMEWKQSLCRL